MLSSFALKFRKRPSPTNIIAVLALFLALGAGAAAAPRIIIKSISQISPSVRAKLKGATGPKGATGVAGLTGATGATGLAGAPGPAGKDGAPGTAGKDGAPGPAGSPWPGGGILAPSATEVGTWAVSATSENNAVGLISFTVRLKEKLEAGAVHYVPKEGNGTTCPGSVELPEAQPGNLCVYQGVSSGAKENEEGIAEALIKLPTTIFPTAGAAVSGAVIKLEPSEAGQDPFAYGTWAVTAAEGS